MKVQEVSIMPHNHQLAEYKPDNDGKNFTFSRFMGLIAKTKPPVGLLVSALLFSVMTTGVQLAIPMFTKGLVDGFSLSTLKTSQIALLGGAFFAQMILSALAVYILNYSGQKVVAALRKLLWKRQISLPVSYFDAHSSGDMISRMTNDTAVIKELITSQLTGFVTGIISMIGAFGLLIYLDWKMTLIMAAAIPLAIVILLPLGNRMHGISRGMMNETARFTSVLSQVLGEARLVKASGAEESEYDRGEEKINNLFTFGLREGKVQALIGPLMSFVMMALLVVIIGYGGYRVSTGALSAGELVAFILYLIQIIMPVTQLTMFFTQLSKTRGATESIITILDTEGEDLYRGEGMERITKAVSFQNVDFAYEADAPVLQGLNFSVEPGQVTAIVGPSGGGKTTIFSLIERFYHPVQGEIHLGGENINNLSLSAWRSKIGYVSQDTPMISGTIRDNITYGLDDEIDDAQLQEAAKMAYAHDFISEYPQGYDTQVGERGVRLSGGQRQRIAIARAFLRAPEILMLDEATASLDSDSEIWVQKALRNLMKGRTVLVIAHRLSTVVDADKILFIEEGRLTGSASHDELMETHEMYRRHAEHQLRSAVTVM